MGYLEGFFSEAHRGSTKYLDGCPGKLMDSHRFVVSDARDVSLFLEEASPHR